VWTMDIGKTVSRAGTTSVPQLLEVLKENGSNSEIVDMVLIAIARMGPSVKSAYPDLRRQLDQLITDKSSRLILKLALACIGDISGDEIASIQEALKKKGREVERLFQAITYIGSFDWDAGEIEILLSLYLKDSIDRYLSVIPKESINKQPSVQPDDSEEDYSLVALLALVSMGPRGAQAKATTEAALEKVFPHAIANPYASSGILCGYSLASIREKDAKETIRQVLTSHYFGFSDHTDWAALYSVSIAELNPRVPKILREFIMGDDWEAIPGAIYQLAVIDDSSEDLIPRLMDIVEGKSAFKVRGKRLEEIAADERIPALSDRDWCRGVAVFMIGMFGDKSLLPRLEKILESNTSISRGWLEEAIKEIKVRPW
jgi:hypothetical protein